MINLYINTVQSQKNRKNLVYHIFRLNDFLIGLDGVILDETVIKNLIYLRYLLLLIRFIHTEIIRERYVKLRDMSKWIPTKYLNHSLCSVSILLLRNRRTV